MTPVGTRARRAWVAAAGWEAAPPSRDHRVTWELGPWQELVDHRPLKVGFELRLYGQHPPHAYPPPGCEKCVAVFDGLRAVAEAALPREQRLSQYDIRPFDAALHLRPDSEWAPEVQLTVHIVHRNGYLSPVDECEKRCADEIQRNLKQLGVQQKTWSKYRAPSVRREPAPAGGAPEGPAGRRGGRRRERAGADASGFFPLRAQRIAAFEREYLTGLLRASGGDVSDAAREAGIPRGTLYRLLKKHDLVPESFRGGTDT